MKFFDTLVSFDNPVGNDGKLVINYAQEIPEDFISQLKADKINPDHLKCGEFMRVASIPTSIYEEWKRQGYDAAKEPIKETLKRLRALHMDAFITTNKSI